MTINKDAVKQYLRFLIITTPAALINSLAFIWFYTTNGIAIGGATGLAQIINRIFGAPPLGILVILINIPLFILGLKLIGVQVLVSSLYIMLLSSIAMDIIPQFFTFAPMEPLLACIYGGLIMGATGGMVLQQGGSFGGSDLGARLLKLKFKWLPIGRLMMAVNLVILTLSSIISHELNSLMYGLVALYVSSLATDGVLYGMDKSQVAYIISDSYREISKDITGNLHRGVTMLEGHGAWSGASKEVLMVAFKQREIVTVKQLVKDIDPNAFMIVCPAHEVLGSGFRFYQKNEL